MSNGPSRTMWISRVPKGSMATSRRSNGGGHSSWSSGGFEESPFIVEGGGTAFFPRMESVPEQLRPRAVIGVMVPLLPGEAQQLRTGRPEASVDAEDEPILRLVARGATRSDIARRLRVPLRTVERRLARMRDRFGLRSHSELVAFLARRGF